MFYTKYTRRLEDHQPPTVTCIYKSFADIEEIIYSDKLYGAQTKPFTYDILGSF